MRVLAVDPGGTTGMAWVQYADGTKGSFNEYSWESTTVLNEVWYRIVDNFDVVIAEQFASAGPNTKYAAQTLRIIGGIEALCWETGAKYVPTFPPRRMPYVERAEQTIGRAGTIHAKTALAHLYAWEEHNL